MKVFGPQRVLWGRDWPVLERAASTGQWWSDVSALLDPLPESDRAAVLGRNALRTYRLSSAHDDRASLLSRS